MTNSEGKFLVTLANKSAINAAKKSAELQYVKLKKKKFLRSIAKTKVGARNIFYQ